MKSVFKKLKTQYHSYRRSREEIKKKASDALNKSKQAIFALHRDDFKSGQKLLREAELCLKNIARLVKKDKSLAFEGSYRAAMEEFVEAKLFWQVLKKKKIEFIKGLEISFNGYLAGICDMTGELVRKAVQLATRGDYKGVQMLRKIVEQMISELIQLNLTGYLRTKYDAAKRNLKKLEEILYDIKIRHR